jgi:hypothetical protein
VGWLRGTRGLCVDNVISADVVTADGRLFRVSAEENPDLYWGIRGGGGNFGIVVSFEFRLQPIEPTLMFCAAVYPETRGAELLAAWRDFMVTAPKQLSSLAEFSTIPDDPEYPEEARGVRVLALAAVFDGPADEGEAAVAPLRSLGTPLLDFSGKMPYRTIQAMYDPLFPKGRDRSYFRSLYLPKLDDGAINDIMSGLTERPSEMTFSSIWVFQRNRPERLGGGDGIRRPEPTLALLHRWNLVEAGGGRCQRRLGTPFMDDDAAALQRTLLRQLLHRPRRRGAGHSRWHWRGDA